MKKRGNVNWIYPQPIVMKNNIELTLTILIIDIEIGTFD